MTGSDLTVGESTCGVTITNVTGDCSLPWHEINQKTFCSCDASNSFQPLFLAGIVVHIIGSIGINTGQNMQAMGLVQMDESDREKCSALLKSKMWTIGCAIFVGASIVNFGALALAPASILVPLEAVQFICNVIFNKVVNKRPIPLRMQGGVFAMCIGVACAVLFGENDSACFTEPRIRAFWTISCGWTWWLYCFVTFGISAVCLYLHRVLWRQKREIDKARAEGKTPPAPPVKNMHLVMPILYATPSALLGGGQMIVQSKALSELLELTINPIDPTATIPMADWFFWVELILVSVLGSFWFVRLTQSLGMYDPLFIIPLMQASFIIWGGIAGGIFFNEFSHITEGRAGVASPVLYVFGLMLIIFGLYLVRPEVPTDQMEPAHALPQPTSESRVVSDKNAYEVGGAAEPVRTDPVTAIGSSN